MEFSNKISIIGTGYVGLVSGACLAEFGMNVICMDKDESKINSLKNGELFIYEPGLLDIVNKNVKEGRLSFTADFDYAVNNSEVVFIAVGTPEMEDGSADLQHVLEVANDIAERMDEYKVIVNKSTVPVGTGKKVKHLMKKVLDERQGNISFDVVSNPEFLREGCAIRDFTHPDRIILGVESRKAEEIMKKIYEVLYITSVPFVITNLETAEIIKYASNAFLATKISFINEIANLCELVGADVIHVAKSMGMDGRIGGKFLHPGPGFGGSCFPKDIKAIVNTAKEYGGDLKIIDTVIKVNQNQKQKMVEKILNKLGCTKNPTATILGLSFKPETDDLRESPAIYIIEQLLKRDVNIKTYDPVAMNNCSKYYPKFKIEYCLNEYEACADSDILIFVTEWNQFRSLNLNKVKELMRHSIFMDLRNIYEPNYVKSLGFDYEGVGRK